jgi:hypothetical protein
MQHMGAREIPQVREDLHNAQASGNERLSGTSMLFNRRHSAASFRWLEQCFHLLLELHAKLVPVTLVIEEGVVSKLMFWMSNLQPLPVSRSLR